MSSLLFRQLKDIQLQADRLTKDGPNDGDLEVFSNYNEELRNYIHANIEDEDITRLVDEIPYVLEVQEVNTGLPLFMLIVVGVLTLGISAIYLSYLAGMRRTRVIQNNIQTARGKYASIEFLLMAQE